MKYWVYMNNEVRGPFEQDKLAGIPDFNKSSLVCPETRDGEQSPGWKEASSCPELSASVSPAPAAAAPQVQRPAPEDMLELTMRGSLVSAPEIEEPVTPPPPGQAKAGDLVFSPPPGKPAVPAAAEGLKPLPAGVSAAAGPDPLLEPLKKKLEQMGEMMSSINAAQSQLTGRLGLIESAISDMKALLSKAPPKQD